MPRRILGSFAGLLCAGTRLVEGKDYCFGVNNEQYRCEMGYCCGETECCTYYYELWCKHTHTHTVLSSTIADGGDAVCQTGDSVPRRSVSCISGASNSFIFSSSSSLTCAEFSSLFSFPTLWLGLVTCRLYLSELLSGFWTDCKLPDYEEVVGHPPTPPPPYSEVPSEAQPPINRPEAAVVLELPAEASDRPSCDWTDQEDPNTRRRHVTGDSGIEVCVCQLDVDEGLGPEEGRLCQGAAGGCCSERQIDANKALMSEPNGDAERLV
ncbi:WW domain-binding protein 1 [Triplophysa rosa]|uniref:WW domain-binding protein 1 n=1 Tax=Triplophysa rosa TaxID=992332 RepID=UPI002545D5FB|nr:WW domain-binding protein 1 [Triplophysa rosa]